MSNANKILNVKYEEWRDIQLIKIQENLKSVNEVIQLLLDEHKKLKEET